MLFIFYPSLNINASRTVVYIYVKLKSKRMINLIVLHERQQNNFITECLFIREIRWYEIVPPYQRLSKYIINIGKDVLYKQFQLSS